MTMVFRSKNTFMKRCDKCGKLSHYTYRISLGNISYTFCSGLCTDAAKKEFDFKQKNGISPDNSEPIEGGDSLEE